MANKELPAWAVNGAAVAIVSPRSWGPDDVDDAKIIRRTETSVWVKVLIVQKDGLVPAGRERRFTSAKWGRELEEWGGNRSGLTDYLLPADDPALVTIRAQAEERDMLNSTRAAVERFTRKNTVVAAREAKDALDKYLAYYAVKEATENE